VSFSFGIGCRRLFLCVLFLSIVLHHKLSDAKVLTAGSLNLYLEQSDNIFSSPADTAVGGTTYLLSPTLSLTIPGRKMRWGLSYSYAYEKNEVEGSPPSGARTPNLTPVSSQRGYERQYHNLTANTGWDLTRKINMNLVGSYNINFQSVQPGQTLNFAPTEQTRTDTSSLNWTTLWTPTKKLRNDFSVFRTATMYDNAIVADMMTTGATYTLSYDFLRWVQIGGGAKYSKNEYETPSASGSGTAVGTAPNAPLDMTILNYNLNANLDLKYFVIGLSYGLLQTRTRGKTVTSFSAGGGPLIVTNNGGAGIVKNLASVFAVNIAANPKTFKIKNLSVEINSGQQFNVDLAGQGYISRTLGVGLGYTWKSISSNLSISRNQDRYINNNNQVLGTVGTLGVTWRLTKRTGITLSGTRTKYEYEADADASLTAIIGVGPTSFPQGQPTTVVQEVYIDLTHSWTKWLTSGISVGRRESESLSSFTVAGSGTSAGQSIDTSYVENLITFSTTATF